MGTDYRRLAYLGGDNAITRAAAQTRRRIYFRQNPPPGPPPNPRVLPARALGTTPYRGTGKRDALPHPASSGSESVSRYGNYYRRDRRMYGHPPITQTLRGKSQAL